MSPLVDRSVALLAAAVLLVAGVAGSAAQDVALDAPISRYVFDLHGAIVPFGQNVDLTVSRGFEPGTDPGRGWGVGGGAHLYFWRLGFVTFGLGATVVKAWGERPPDPPEEPEEGEEPLPPGPTLRKTMTAVAPQLSFNFGGRNGWSYISGGPGTSTLALFDAAGPEPDQASTSTFNYGGGARWFTRNRLALALDLRFYNASPIEATPTEPGSPRITTMVLSIGASFR